MQADITPKATTASAHSHLVGCRCTALPTQFSSAFTRRCLAQKSRSSHRGHTVVRAAEIKPAYNKYRSRDDIDQDYIRKWKETTARDSQPRRLSPFTFLWYVPVFIKYNIIPNILRYAWWLVWSSLLAAKYQIQKRLVLQGAKLDVQLMKSGKTKHLSTFSRQLALQRLHGKVGFLDTLKYRIALFQGEQLDQFFASSHEQVPEQDADTETSVLQPGSHEYLNQMLPDLAVYVKEEQDETSDGDAASSENLQSAPA